MAHKDVIGQGSMASDKSEKEATVLHNGSTSVHPFGAGYAVPTGRDEAPGATQAQLSAAAAELAAAPAAERAALLREILADSGGSDGLASWVVGQLLLSSPEAAARATGLGDVLPEDELSAEALQNLLTPEEEEQFAERGYFVVPSALAPEQVATVLDSVAKVDDAFRLSMGIAETERMDLLDCLGAATSVGEGEPLLDLVDLPTTFPKVWGLLSSANISLYHTQISVQPPLPQGTPPERLGCPSQSPCTAPASVSSGRRGGGRASRLRPAEH